MPGIIDSAVVPVNPVSPKKVMILAIAVVGGVALGVLFGLFLEFTDDSIRSSAQGVFMMMTNGFGATVGSLCAQAIVNHYTHSASKIIDGSEVFFTIGEWPTAWYIFAAFALVVGILFAILFKYKHNPEKVS